MSKLITLVREQRTLYMAAIGLLTFLGLWQAVISIFGVPIYLVPSPFDVAEAIKEDYSLLASSALLTATEAFFGFILGTTIGIVVAISFVYNKVLEELFYPVAVIVKIIPIIAIAPVLKIILGNGMEPKIVIAGLITFFPVLVNSVRGFKAVNPQLLELMHILSASKVEVFRRVRIYSSLPYIFSALKISVTMSVIGAIVGEWIGSKAGLGYLILMAMYEFNSPRLFATIGLASLIAITGFSLVSMLEKKLIRWDAGDSF